MNYVIMYSGGAASFEAASRVLRREDASTVTCLFADTLIEDPDLYRFLDQTIDLLGVRLVRLCDGRTPWQVFRDERFIGNTRIDPCSKILKRQLCDTWLAANCDPASTVVVLGLDWTELHRVTTTTARYAEHGWKTEYPLTEAPWFHKATVLSDLELVGIDTPRLYRLGFEHNNCGGFCVKAGQGHFARLLRELPEVYASHEAEEERTRQYLGRDLAILRDRRGGKTKPMTLRDLRTRIATGQEPDPTDVGGCGCFSDL